MFLKHIDRISTQTLKEGIKRISNRNTNHTTKKANLPTTKTDSLVKNLI